MVIIITGASSGIGLVVAQALAAKGHHVYGISRTKTHEKNIKSIQADVTDFEQLQTCYRDIFDIEGRIDVLINNAGFGISGSIEGTSIEDAKKLMDVNFMGVFHSTKAVLPYMRASKYGKIIQVSSVASRLAIPFQAFYSSSKAAINAFSEALNIEVKPYGIHVCTLMPGDIKTGFTKNRKKNLKDPEVYKNRIDRSVGVMEQDEFNGMDPMIAANVVCVLVNKKSMPLYKTIGFKYKVFVLLHKILPAKLANHIVGSIYGFIKD